MLILTRRIGETLRIGDDVSITVLDVQGNQVRIGVDAPKEIAVHRKEIYQRIQREKQAQAKTEVEEEITSGNFAVKDVMDNALTYFSTEGSQQKPKKSPTVIVKKRPSGNKAP